MKKRFLILFALILCTCLALFATSCTKIPRPPKPETSIESTTESKPLPDGVKVEFNTLTSNGTEVYGKVSNSTTEFDFKEEISISRANFVVSSDPYGKDTFFAKKIPLELGDNSVYLFITIDDEIIFTYNVTIRRRPTYDVTFSANGGTAVEKQVVEEDSLATEPQAPTKVGYTFTGWDYDFTQPITGNTKITASWVAIANTPYKVEYYLQNFDGDYELDHTDSLQGETDTTATAQIKTFDHFAFNESASTLSGDISGDGSLVLRLYYTRINYEIKTMTNNSQAGEITGSGTYCYGKQIALSATTYLGYTFVGWYDGDTLVSKDAQFTFVADKHVGLVAIFEVKPEMSSFNFTSTTTTCTITGIKDRTVTEVVIPDCVTSIGYDAFYGCSNLQYNTEGELKYLGNANNPYLYLADTTSTSITSATINDNCKLIGSAFYWCSSLTSVVIGDSVTSIGDYAFYYCYKLVEVVNKSTNITVTKGSSSNGFVGCYALAVYNSGDAFTSKLSDDNGYIVYTDGTEKILLGYNGAETDLVLPSYITTIYRYAFYDCSSLTSVEIGDSVTAIGDYAFAYCDSLTSVVIPDSVTSIGYGAFVNCSRLTTVYYKGATSDWAKISISTSNGNLTSAMRYYYSENEPAESDKYWHYDEDGQIEIYHTHTYTTLNFDSANHWYECVCGDRSNSIPHTYNIEYDDTNHWHECVCGHNINSAPHTFNIENDALNHWYKCVCGYVHGKVAHFGGTATYTEKAICEVCAQPYGDYLVEPFTEGLVFSLQSTNSYAVTDYVGTSTEVKIPSTYKNLPVTSIGNRAFYNCSSLTSVEIGDSVTSIGAWAFEYCDRLVEVVNKSTFITVTKGSTANGYVGYYALAVYNSGDTFTSKLSDDNGYIVYTDGAEQILLGYNGAETDLVLPSYITTIYRYAFKECSSLTSVVIGDSVTSIGSSAFYYCSKLTSVVIPDSVTSIGSSAFYNCTSLTSVVIPNSVTSIGNSAFDFCSKLQYNAEGELKYLGNANNPYLYLEDTTSTSITSATINDNCKIIGDWAFYGCNSLTSVEIPDSVTSIGDDAFRSCSRLTSVVIGDSVTSIGWNAFYECSSLKSVYITDLSAWCKISGLYNLMYYGSSTKNLYLNNELVTELIIPDSVTSIGKSAFYYCRSLTSVVIGDSVTSIGNSAFYNCSSLTSVVIGNSVTSIGERAFEDCSSLTSVVIGDSVTSIGNSAFYNCIKLQYNTEGNLKYLGNANNPYLYLADTTSTSITSATINDNCKIIGYSAFYYCSKLTSVVIPDSVTSIGSSAFKECSSLTSVVIGDSVTSIGEYAFSGCSSLTSIEIPDSVTSIDDYTFYYCSSLKSIVIPDSVTSIGDCAFAGCMSLTSVVIGDSVTSIGDCAFEYCISLTSIKYRGTQAQWNAISKNDYWNYDTGSYTITYNYNN